MKILAIYPYFPDERTRVRSSETLRLLRALGDVTVAFPSETRSPDLSGFACRVLTIRDSRFWRLSRIVGAILSRRSISSAYYKNITNYLLNIIDDDFDLVFVERLSVAFGLSSRANVVIYDAVDSFKEQTTLLARAAKGLKKYGYRYDAKLIGDEQVESCNRATGVLCTTELEKARLIQAGVTAPIHAYLHNSQVTRLAGINDETNSSRQRVVFHGRGSYAANQAAARYIRHDIAPAAPEVDFIIFGADWPEKQVANLKIFGFQPDLSLLWSADYAIFPFEAAVGIQNKVIEALAAGLPCVVTPIVAEGLPRVLKAELFDRIIVIELDRFADYIRAMPNLVRSEEASDRFESIYTLLMADNEVDTLNFMRAFSSRLM